MKMETRVRLNPMFSLRWPLALAMAVLMVACGKEGSGPVPDKNPGLAASVSVTPTSTGDGWQVSTPAAEGMEADKILAALQQIRDGGAKGVDSMVVARHGKLVGEGYFNGYGPDTLHDLRSSGKSFTSALAGIAINQGLFGIDDPISQIIPGFDNYDNMDARKRAISIRNLLDMSSGLRCSDWDSGSPGNEEKMYHSNDWVRFILDLPMSVEPGLVANYCTGGVVVLGSVIARRSGMTLDAYAQTWLFDPLSIRQSEWRRSPDGQATGGGGLKLRPRDFAKLGQLYLDGGVWNGARVVPESWVDLSQMRNYTLGGDGYGLLWWKRALRRGAGTVECFFTSGNGGNYVFVIPELDLVAVFTGSNYDGPMDAPFQIMEQRVLTSML
jgi:CubicO group peptidase (beta-lactamase class C family)